MIQHLTKEGQEDDSTLHVAKSCRPLEFLAAPFAPAARRAMEWGREFASLQHLQLPSAWPIDHWASESQGRQVSNPQAEPNSHAWAALASGSHAAGRRGARPGERPLERRVKPSMDCQPYRSARPGPRANTRCRTKVWRYAEARLLCAKKQCSDRRRSYPNKPLRASSRKAFSLKHWGLRRMPPLRYTSGKIIALVMRHTLTQPGRGPPKLRVLHGARWTAAVVECRWILPTFVLAEPACTELKRAATTKDNR
jgi:hypothetical protein